MTKIARTRVFQLIGPVPQFQTGFAQIAHHPTFENVQYISRFYTNSLPSSIVCNHCESITNWLPNASVGISKYGLTLALTTSPRPYIQRSLGQRIESNLSLSCAACLQTGRNCHNRTTHLCLPITPQPNSLSIKAFPLLTLPLLRCPQTTPCLPRYSTPCAK